MSVNINGSNHNITTGNNSPIIVNKSNKKKVQDNLEKFYQKWWFISLFIGCVGGIIIGLNLNSFIIGLFSTITMWLIILFFNPKRRFMRIGLLTLSMGTLNLLPKFSGLFTISKENFMIFEHNTSDILGIFLILLSGYLFHLDYQQK